MSDEIDDIDSPADEALLRGQEDDDPEALAEIAAEEGEQEAEGEGEAEAESSEEPEANEEAPAPPKRDALIPRDRFDEVNARRKEAEDRARELEARIAALEASSRQPDPTPEPQPAIDLEAKEREYLEATYVGDTDAAIALRKEIQAEERRLAAEAARAEVAQREAVNSVKSVAAKAVADYPFLNDNNGNNAAMDKILRMRDFYAFEGHSPADALRMAVDEVAPAFAPAQAPQARAADPRKAAAVARNAAASAAQPPAQVAGVGNRVAPPSPRVETQADWEKLPAAERERLLQGA